MTKPIDPVAFDLRQAKELVRAFAPLLRPMIAEEVAAALQQCRDEQRPNEPEVYTLTEACKYLHISKSKFYELLKTGRAPKHMLCGAQYRFTKKDLDDWLAEEHERAKSAEVQLARARRQEMYRELGKKAGQSEKHVSQKHKKKKGND